MSVEPWQWLVFGIVLMIAEMFVPTFFLLWFGAGAIVTALVAMIAPLGFLPMVIVWLVLSILFCVAWFKFVQPLAKDRTKAGLGGSVIIGEIGMLVRVPSLENTGIVRFAMPKLGATEWECCTKDETYLQVGDRVVVLDILGNELLIAKK